VPPRFGSSSATAGAAIDIALTKTATAAAFPIGCLKLDLPMPGRSGFAIPQPGAHFSHVSRPSPRLSGMTSNINQIDSLFSHQFYLSSQIVGQSRLMNRLALS
jgi:hypothetical protein